MGRGEQDDLSSSNFLYRNINQVHNAQDEEDYAMVGPILSDKNPTDMPSVSSFFSTKDLATFLKNELNKNSYLSLVDRERTTKEKLYRGNNSNFVLSDSSNENWNWFAFSTKKFPPSMRLKKILKGLTKHEVNDEQLGTANKLYNDYAEFFFQKTLMKKPDINIKTGFSFIRSINGSAENAETIEPFGVKDVQLLAHNNMTPEEKINNEYSSLKNPNESFVSLKDMIIVEAINRMTTGGNDTHWLYNPGDSYIIHASETTLSQALHNMTEGKYSSPLLGAVRLQRRENTSTGQ